MALPKWKKGEPYSSPQQFVADILAGETVWWDAQQRPQNAAFLMQWPLAQLYALYGCFSRAAHNEREGSQALSLTPLRSARSSAPGEDRTSESDKMIPGQEKKC